MTTEPTNPGKRMTEHEMVQLYERGRTGLDLSPGDDLSAKAFDRIVELESELTAKDRQHMMAVNGLVEQLDKMKEVEQQLADAKLEAAKWKLSCAKWATGVENSNTDIVDMQRDEFRRIINLTDNTEIKGLCERAITTIEQTVPVVVQRDRLELKVAHLLAKQNDDIEAHQLIVNGLELKVQELRAVLTEIKEEVQRIGGAKYEGSFESHFRELFYRTQSFEGVIGKALSSTPNTSEWVRRETVLKLREHLTNTLECTYCEECYNKAKQVRSSPRENCECVNCVDCRRAQEALNLKEKEGE